MIDLATLADAHGTPCFVYDLAAVAARAEALAGLGVEVSYAVKANPAEALLRFLRGRVAALDVSSLGEVERAVAAGWDAARLMFTGPAKREAELVGALAAGVGAIVLESVEEARALARLAGDRRPRALARINLRQVTPGFGLRMSGRPSRFGIDEEEADAALAEILALPLSLVGLHGYAGAQCLDAAAIARNVADHLAVFAGLAERHGLGLERVVVGPGIGVPQREGEAAVTVEALGAALAEVPTERLTLELGRYLVGEAGTYLTRVLRVKRSRGVTFAICDGGMHHHQAACGLLGSVIHRNPRLFVVGAEAGAATEPVEVVGPLCTPIDRLGRAVALPSLAPGDLVGVACCGAYGPSASPVDFISHPRPAEVWVE